MPQSRMNRLNEYLYSDYSCRIQKVTNRNSFSKCKLSQIPHPLDPRRQNLLKNLKQQQEFRQDVPIDDNLENLPYQIRLKPITFFDKPSRIAPATAPATRDPRRISIMQKKNPELYKNVRPTLVDKVDDKNGQFWPVLEIDLTHWPDSRLSRIVLNKSEENVARAAISQVEVVNLDEDNNIIDLAKEDDDCLIVENFIKKPPAFKDNEVIEIVDDVAEDQMKTATVSLPRASSNSIEEILCITDSDDDEKKIVPEICQLDPTVSANYENDKNITASGSINEEPQNILSESDEIFLSTDSDELMTNDVNSIELSDDPDDIVNKINSFLNNETTVAVETCESEICADLVPFANSDLSLVNRDSFNLQNEEIANISSDNSFNVNITGSWGQCGFNNGLLKKKIKLRRLAHSTLNFKDTKKILKLATNLGLYFKPCEVLNFIFKNSQQNFKNLQKSSSTDLLAVTFNNCVKFRLDHESTVQIEEVPSEQVDEKSKVLLSSTSTCENRCQSTSGQSNSHILSHWSLITPSQRSSSSSFEAPTSLNLYERKHSPVSDFDSITDTSSSSSSSTDQIVNIVSNDNNGKIVPELEKADGLPKPTSRILSTQRVQIKINILKRPPTTGNDKVPSPKRVRINDEQKVYLPVVKPIIPATPKFGEFLTVEEDDFPKSNKKDELIILDQSNCNFGKDNVTISCTENLNSKNELVVKNDDLSKSLEKDSLKVMDNSEHDNLKSKNESHFNGYLNANEAEKIPFISYSEQSDQNKIYPCSQNSKDTDEEDCGLVIDLPPKEMLVMATESFENRNFNKSDFKDVYLEQPSPSIEKVNTEINTLNRPPLTGEVVSPKRLKMFNEQRVHLSVVKPTIPATPKFDQFLAVEEVDFSKSNMQDDSLILDESNGDIDKDNVIMPCIENQNFKNTNVVKNTDLGKSPEKDLLQIADNLKHGNLKSKIKFFPNGYSDTEKISFISYSGQSDQDNIFLCSQTSKDTDIEDGELVIDIPSEEVPVRAKTPEDRNPEKKDFKDVHPEDLSLKIKSEDKEIIDSFENISDNVDKCPPIFIDDESSQKTISANFYKSRTCDDNTDRVQNPSNELEQESLLSNKKYSENQYTHNKAGDEIKRILQTNKISLIGYQKFVYPSIVEKVNETVTSKNTLVGGALNIESSPKTPAATEKASSNEENWENICPEDSMTNNELGEKNMIDSSEKSLSNCINNKDGSKVGKNKVHQKIASAKCHDNAEFHKNISNSRIQHSENEVLQQKKILKESQNNAIGKVTNEIKQASQTNAPKSIEWGDKSFLVSPPPVKIKESAIEKNSLRDGTRKTNFDLLGDEEKKRLQLQLAQKLKKMKEKVTSESVKSSSKSKTKSYCRHNSKPWRYSSSYTTSDTNQISIERKNSTKVDNSELEVGDNVNDRKKSEEGNKPVSSSKTESKEKYVISSRKLFHFEKPYKKVFINHSKKIKKRHDAHLSVKRKIKEIHRSSSKETTSNRYNRIRKLYKKFCIKKEVKIILIDIMKDPLFKKYHHIKKRKHSSPPSEYALVSSDNSDTDSLKIKIRKLNAQPKAHAIQKDPLIEFEKTATETVSELRERRQNNEMENLFGSDSDDDTVVIRNNYCEKNKTPLTCKGYSICNDNDEGSKQCSENEIKQPPCIIEETTFSEIVEEPTREVENMTLSKINEQRISENELSALNNEMQNEVVKIEYVDNINSENLVEGDSDYFDIMAKDKEIQIQQRESDTDKTLSNLQVTQESNSEQAIPEKNIEYSEASNQEDLENIEENQPQISQRNLEEEGTNIENINFDDLVLNCIVNSFNDGAENPSTESKKPDTPSKTVHIPSKIIEQRKLSTKNIENCLPDVGEPIGPIKTILAPGALEIVFKNNESNVSDARDPNNPPEPILHSGSPETGPTTVIEKCKGPKTLLELLSIPVEVQVIPSIMSENHLPVVHQASRLLETDQLSAVRNVPLSISQPTTTQNESVNDLSYFNELRKSLGQPIFTNESDQIGFCTMQPVEQNQVAYTQHSINFHDCNPSSSGSNSEPVTQVTENSENHIGCLRVRRDLSKSKNYDYTVDTSPETHLNPEIHQSFYVPNHNPPINQRQEQPHSSTVNLIGEYSRERESVRSSPNTVWSNYHWYHRNVAYLPKFLASEISQDELEKKNETPSRRSKRHTNTILQMYKIMERLVKNYSNYDFSPLLDYEYMINSSVLEHQLLLIEFGLRFESFLKEKNRKCKTKTTSNTVQFLMIEKKSPLDSYNPCLDDIEEIQKRYKTLFTWIYERFGSIKSYLIFLDQLYLLQNILATSIQPNVIELD